MHFEQWNGSGWSSSNNDCTHWSNPQKPLKHNTMKKKVKVHMIPTGDITGIVMHSTGLDKIVHTKESELNADLNIGGTSQHLYLTSDEKIEDDDWCLNLYNSPHTVMQVHVGGKDWKENKKAFRRIVATTDNLFVKECQVCKINKHHRYNFAQCKCKYLPQIPQSFIKQYVESGGKIDEVELECENIQKTINYHKDLWEDNWIIKTDSNNCVIVHPIKNSWSREEVIDIIYKSSYVLSNGDMTKKYADNWIKNNLK